MATRTVKLYGKVWGDPADPATITVSFEGQQRYQGPVTTVSGILDAQCAFSDMIVMATWEIGLDVVGPNDFSFTVSGGDAIFHTFHGNYAGDVVQTYKFVAGATWPAYQPIDADQVVTDIQQMSPAAFESQYGLTKAQAQAQVEPDQVLPTDQNWNDLSGLSTMESDGHDDVVIDGIPQVRDPNPEELGKWIWPVLDGQTLTCQVQTVPAVL